jgi:uncharacterized protein (TIGR00661 family)
MKFVFLVQGEGRGHMTQAIAFAKMLEESGHQVGAVILGRSKRRTVPEFFRRQFSIPIEEVESPNFEADKNEKGVLIGKTIPSNLRKLPSFWTSILSIDAIVKQEKPDVILNFYDLLGGFYTLLFRPKAAYWVIGHQYLSAHPSFIFASSRHFQKQLFLLNTWITAWGADRRLALSSLKTTSNASILVVPPLLRPEVKNLIPKPGDFYLAYMVNSGYGSEVMSFAKLQPNLKIKAYWDKKDAAEVEHPLPNLSFHQIHDQNFLQDMADCKGLICTAGFESICEAMYLGKPVMVIPLAGQYEQSCNALDAVASGAGIKSKNFDFGYFHREISNIQTPDQEIQAWVEEWPKIMKELVLETKRPTQMHLFKNNHQRFSEKVFGKIIWKI